jgi:chorismate mutase
MTTNKPIEKYRNEIDDLNKKIVDLLGKRMDLARKIGKIKRKEGIQVRDYEREHQVLTAIREYARLHDLPEKYIEQVFELIIKASREEQK